MRLYKEDCAALLVDIQEKLVPVVQDGTELVGTCQKLIRGLQIFDIPILPIRHYPKGLGDLHKMLRDELNSDCAMDKLQFSALGQPDIRQWLQSQKKKRVIVFGMEAHVCVLQTVLDLVAEGYTVVLVVDCVTSRKKLDKEIALQRAAKVGAILTTYESLLFELLQEAGTEKCREILKLVK